MPCRGAVKAAPPSAVAELPEDAHGFGHVKAAGGLAPTIRGGAIRGSTRLRSDVKTSLTRGRTSVKTGSVKVKHKGLRELAEAGVSAKGAGKSMDENTIMTMANPSHPRELLREAMQDLSWNVGETAAQLGVTRQCVSRVLNARGGVKRPDQLSIPKAVLAFSAIAVDAAGQICQESAMRMELRRPA